MKQRWMIGSISALSALFTAPVFGAEAVVVYTAFETDVLAKYKVAFEQANPDIEIKWVRDSTGIMTAKLLAEKNNPRAEVIWEKGTNRTAFFRGEVDEYEWVDL